MRVIIAGSRTVRNYNELLWVVSGGCPTGVDNMGELWAEENNVGLKRFPADGENGGKAAGPLRNAAMAAYALILVWDGKSKGSASMKKEAKKRDLKIFEHIIQPNPSL